LELIEFLVGLLLHHAFRFDAVCDQSFFLFLESLLGFLKGLFLVCSFLLLQLKSELLWHCHLRECFLDSLDSSAFDIHVGIPDGLSELSGHLAPGGHQ
jgi:hypothetical protein